MKSKLILVEGLPGSGKSTTAQLIFEILKEMKIEAKLYMEGNLDHPADYEGVAYYTQREFELLLASCTQEFKGIFLDRVVKQNDHYFLPYQKIVNELEDKFPDDISSTLHKHDIYELPLNLSNQLISEKWRHFTEHARNSEIVYVFECCFIQNPVTLGMIKYDAAKEEVMNQVTNLATIIASLNPLLIYVEQSNLDFSFRKAVQERPTDWSNGFIQYYTNQGYGKEREYSGLEGTLQVLQARAELENELLGHLQINTIRVNNSFYDLNQHKVELFNIMQSHPVY